MNRERSQVVPAVDIGLTIPSAVLKYTAASFAALHALQQVQDGGSLALASMRLNEVSRHFLTLSQSHLGLLAHLKDQHGHAVPCPSALHTMYLQALYRLRSKAA